jgi:hypothetical protein
MSRIKTSKIRDIRDIRGKKITTDCFAYSTFGLDSQIMKLHCLADEGSNSLRFSNSKVKSHHRFYGFYRLKHIKSVTSVISVVKKHIFVLLTKEAIHPVSILSKKKSHRFYGCYRLSRIKSVISAVKKTPLCLADERSNSLRFSNTKIKKPQLQKQSSKAFNFEIAVFKFYKPDLRVSNKISYLLLNLLCAFRY